MVPSGGGLALIDGLAAHFEAHGGKFFLRKRLRNPCCRTTMAKSPGSKQS